MSRSALAKGLLLCLLSVPVASAQAATAISNRDSAGTNIVQTNYGDDEYSGYSAPRYYSDKPRYYSYEPDDEFYGEYDHYRSPGSSYAYRDYDDCLWLRQRALFTESSYWWRRYRSCRGW